MSEPAFNLSLPCPSCEVPPWSSVGLLAGHLHRDHGLNHSNALRRAQDVAADKVMRRVGERTATEGEAMATTAGKRKCRACGEPGHRANKCPSAAMNGGPPKRATKASMPVDDNGARATAKTLLAQLEALRSRLDDKIAHVKELATIL